MTERTFPIRPGFDCPSARIEVTAYADGSFAIQLWTHQPEEGPVEPLATLSVNLPPYSKRLPPNCFYVKTYSENELIARDVAMSGWFKPRHDLPPRAAGWAVCTVWELLAEKGPGFTPEEMEVEGI